MSGPELMRLYDGDEEPVAAEESDLNQELPSGAATVRAERGGGIVAVEVDPRGLRRVSPAAFTAQLTTAIQQVQRHAADQLRGKRRHNHGRRG